MTVAQVIYGGSPVAFSGNFEVTLLSSAERTCSVSSGDQQNHYSRGVAIAFDVTAITGSPSLTLSLEWKTPLGEYVTLMTAPAVTAVGHHTYILYPDIAAAAADVEVAVGFPLPYCWRVTVAHGTADAVTYSVTASLLQ